MTQDQIDMKKALKEIRQEMQDLYDMNERILEELVKQDTELRQLRYAVHGTACYEFAESDEDRHFWEEVCKTEDSFTEKFNKQQ